MASGAFSLNFPAWPNDGLQLITAGIDLSSQDAGTACCIIDWKGSKAVVHSLEVKVDDQRLCHVMREASLTGIDIPLGWPALFVDAVTRYCGGEPWPKNYRHQQDKRDYYLRRTDIWVSELPPLRGIVPPRPLSVAADRIAIPAMRAAALLSKALTSEPIDGSGRIIEVYPAAALWQWGFRSTGYKGRGHESERTALVDQFLRSLCGSLEISPADRMTCETNDDALDALIAACVARAHLLGLTHSVPDGEHDAARREGWIFLPSFEDPTQLFASMTNE